MKRLRWQPLPSPELIREWLSYDEATGLFKWIKESRPDRPLLGEIAGTRSRKYVLISVPGFRRIAASNLAWILIHGSIPADREIDHKDGNTRNDAIDNLRLATSSQQKQNRNVQANNKSGLKGAYFHACRKGKKWRSQIKVGDKLIFLGYFHTAEEAHRAHARASAEHFGEFHATRSDLAHTVALLELGESVAVPFEHIPLDPPF